jgi:hypothetical protein
LPDNGNSGSSRGSTAHDVFEILATPRHKKHVDKALKDDTCKSSPALWKLVCGHAKKNNVDDAANLDLIDEFIITGLQYKFYGDKDTKEIIVEKYFDFEYEEDFICFHLRGFIDRIYVQKYKDTLVIDIADFKSSKDKFKKDKILLNHQSRFYQIAVTKFLYPELELRSFKFIFLKFRDDPIQDAILIDEAEMYGYMLWLTHIQNQITNFSEADTSSNYAANSPATKWLCGREGIKKDGTTMFLCGCRKPLDYWVVKKDGVIIKSSFKPDIKLDRDEVMEEAKYTGCSYYYDKTGKKRMRNYE